MGQSKTFISHKSRSHVLTSKKHRPEPLCIPLFKLLMNEKHSVQPSAMQMVLSKICSSPLGRSEDSPVIKGELHRCNISKSLLAKWRKKRKGEWSGGRGMGPFFEGGEGRLKSKCLKGLVVKTGRCNQP